MKDNHQELYQQMKLLKPAKVAESRKRAHRFVRQFIHDHHLMIEGLDVVLTPKKEQAYIMLYEWDNADFDKLLFNVFGTGDEKLCRAFPAFIENCRSSRHKIEKEKGCKLPEINVNYSCKNNYGVSVLQHMLWLGNDELFLFAVENGANINTVDNDDLTLLHCALAEKNIRMMNDIIDAGIDINAKNKQGYTPLIIASINYHRETLDVFLAHNPDLNATCHYGANALTYAAKYNQPEAIKALLDKNIDVNAIHSHDKHSALSYCMVHHNYDIAKLLIEHGADSKFPAVLKEYEKSTTPEDIKQIIFDKNYQAPTPQQIIYRDIDSISEAHNKKGQKPRHYHQTQASLMTTIIQSLRENDDLITETFRHEKGSNLLQLAATFSQDANDIAFLSDHGYAINDENQSELLLCALSNHQTGFGDRSIMHHILDKSPLDFNVLQSFLPYVIEKSHPVVIEFALNHPAIKELCHSLERSQLDQLRVQNKAAQKQRRDAKDGKITKIITGYLHEFETDIFANCKKKVKKTRPNQAKIVNDMTDNVNQDQPSHEDSTNVIEPMLHDILDEVISLIDSIEQNKQDALTTHGCQDVITEMVDTVDTLQILDNMRETITTRTSCHNAVDDMISTVETLDMLDKMMHTIQFENHMEELKQFTAIRNTLLTMIDEEDKNYDYKPRTITNTDDEENILSTPSTTSELRAEAEPFIPRSSQSTNQQISK